MHWYLKIPRFDGRKTIAFNGLVFIAASGGLAWSHTGGSPLPVSDTALYLLAAVAAVNGLLRLVTERPVWWRQVQWYGLDMAEEGAAETVYHRAAEFVPDEREMEAARRIIPYADFQRDLDKRLVDTREAFDGQFYGNGPHVLPELPLDADTERG